MKRLSWLAGMALLPGTAQAFVAQNTMTARQIGPTEIAADFESWARDTDYWCAAGDFAQRGLRLSGDTRIWRASPKPRKGGDGLVFTLDPARKAEGAGLSQFGKGTRDGSLTLGAVVGSHCRRILPFWLD